MPLPVADANRRLKHSRTIDVQIFARGNGLWEVDALLRDTNTELCDVLPTAVVQAFAGEVISARAEAHGQRPFPIDRCHALRSDGPLVRTYFPRWFRQSGVNNAPDRSAVAKPSIASPA